MLKPGYTQTMGE